MHPRRRARPGCRPQGMRRRRRRLSCRGRVGAGATLMSMSYVESAADAHRLAADQLAPGSPVAGQAYFINEPDPVNLWSWIDHLLERAGLPPVRKAISTRAAYAAGAALEAV